MIMSLNCFATIEAAAIDSERLSPLIKASAGMGSPRGIILPSTNA